MKVSPQILYALGAALLASCSSVLGPGGASEGRGVGQPWGITVSRLNPADDEGKFEDRGASVSLVRAIDEDTTVGFERGDFEPEEFDAQSTDYTYYRLEYRHWFSPGARLESYLGAGVSFYDYDALDFGLPSSGEYFALSLVAGGGYWISTNLSVDVGVVFDPLTLERGYESAFEEVMMRLGFSIWL